MSTHLQKGEEELEELRGNYNAVDESVDSLQEVLLLSSKELEKLEGKSRRWGGLLFVNREKAKCNDALCTTRTVNC